MRAEELTGWERLRHGGLLLDAQRQQQIATQFTPPQLAPFHEHELRKRAPGILDGSGDLPAFLTLVLQRVCGLTEASRWHRGNKVPPEWGRVAVTGETVKPRQLWLGRRGAVLPVFFDREKRLGIGRGRRITSQVLQWLRGGDEQLAVITNARQWRLVFAGLDFDAWCEWDVDLWFDEGELSPQVTALRTLLSPTLWTPEEKSATSPLLQAILDSRKGQAELSKVLGERVREAVEILIQAHGAALNERCADVDPASIYRAAVRVVMRLVVVLFAESRELLPRDNALYHGSYGLTGLLEELAKTAHRSGGRLARSWNAWPRTLALFRLVHDGSHHPGLPVPAYGGDLFAPGDPESTDGLSRALSVFENACFGREVVHDRAVHRLLELITRTRVKLRQGRSSTWVAAPVDFSDLSSEYIGILYEGLLDFELRTAPAGDPVIFLAVGNQPALPLSRLEAMDDKALKNLLEKMKDTSTPDEGDETAEAGEVEDSEDSEEEDEDDEEARDDELVEEEDDGDERHTTRTRAEIWARRAVQVGGLVRKPRGSQTREKRLAFEAAVATKARQLVTRVVLPGESYLVRWGGTRKGSGTFYTRPGLAVPTVQRTLRPLAWDPPSGDDGTPDREAPANRWTPKKPEEILELKVLDPACGSGTFPVAALRFLTDTLYVSLHHHGRISEDGERSMVALLSGASSAGDSGDGLCQELLPCRVDDPLFEPRLKAVLRRHVVERCVYGVDIDPLAVELCRLALWIETMDRSLPFSFLDHKIKCGNALVGAWFDQFLHYPAMAWKNRNGGDENHSGSVHFEKGARARAIKGFAKEMLAPDLERFLGGRTLFDTADPQERARAVHAEGVSVLSRLHALPVQDADQRAAGYREQFLGSESYRSLKGAMDLWCACWFWPADDLATAPLPMTFAKPTEATRKVCARLSTEKRFFHWELEYPDVFRAPDSGFDSVLGNPPWDIAKPNSKEFFSNTDPLYRAYGKQEALRFQTQYFADEAVEREWLNYSADFRAQSNFMKYAGRPFGDPEVADTSQGRLSIKRGRANAEVHGRWRKARAESRGFSDAAHPFRHQGSADVNLYKLFLEQAHVLLGEGGRLGFIAPSGLYSDHGTRPLRRLFLDRCRWEWLFGFENREGIFDIHRSFKFNPVIVQKGGTTTAIRAAFMRRNLEDWANAEDFGIVVGKGEIDQFSPNSRVLLEFESKDALVLAKQMVAAGIRLGAYGQAPTEPTIRYIHHEFFATADSKLFPPRETWESRGYRSITYGYWQDSDGNRAIPIVEGRMISFYDFSAKAWISGKGRSATWRPIGWKEKVVRPQYLISEVDYREKPEAFAGWKVTLMDVTSATNTRTVIAAPGRGLATVDSCRNLVVGEGDLVQTLCLTHLLNCFVFDWAARYRVGGLHVTWFQLEEMTVPRFHDPATPLIPLAVFRLCAAHVRYAPDWIHLKNLLPALALEKRAWRSLWALQEAERLRLQVMLDAIGAALFQVDEAGMRFVLRECDRETRQLATRGFSRGLEPKGFWRVDKDKDPELRHTVLTLVAFRDLRQKIEECGGDREKGIQAFCTQNDGDGWMLPETLRLADHDLGHDERAKEHQPVASRLGPRFYDGQLAQTPEESWHECRLHARNLLGETGYSKLLKEIEAGEQVGKTELTPQRRGTVERGDPQGDLFE